MTDPTTHEPPAPTKRKRRRKETNAANFEDDVLELGRAIDFYRRRYLRSMPPWSEVLAILKALGYRRVADRAATSTEDCVVAAMNRQIVEPMDCADDDPEADSDSD